VRAKRRQEQVLTDVGPQQPALGSKTIHVANATNTKPFGTIATPGQFGEPAEEIAKIAADRQTGLIVMGLHASAVSGARMGSVTYRVLSVTHALVLALPPPPAS
jgi:nucleotide-binding universal stress UspA family protein